jgi:metal transporter CNNM
MSYITLIIIILLVLLSGLFSGLTLGLLGLDKTELERKIKLKDKRAIKVYSVRKKGNLLLCTLLLGNVAVNAALAIFLGSLATGIVAGLVSTGLIVIFGEIIPQATISRYAMAFGSKTAWLVKFFIVILSPICWPIAKTLDYFLGEEMPTIWSKNELEEIIKFHQKSKNSSLDADEERIILGALSYSNKTAENVLTPRKVVFSLESKTILNKKVLNKIKKSGFTRIPIYRENIDNIIGVLYVKKLIGIGKGKKVKDICQKKNIFKINKNKKLDVLLNDFIKRKIHLAIVFNEYGEFEGIISLEDILEEILRMQIVDEEDTVKDMQKLAKRK